MRVFPIVNSTAVTVAPRQILFQDNLVSGTNRSRSENIPEATAMERRKLMHSQKIGGSQPKRAKNAPVAERAVLMIRDTSNRKPQPRTMPNERKRSLTIPIRPPADSFGSTRHSWF